VLAWLFAYVVRYNLNALTVPIGVWVQALKLLPLIVISQIIFFRVFKTYRPLWRFSSLPELIRLCKASLCAWILSVIMFFSFS
jgi:FlaA1/EpsC-like NDP-sugar epimerase